MEEPSPSPPAAEQASSLTGFELARCYRRLFWLLLAMMVDFSVGSFSCLHMVWYALIVSALRPLSFRDRRFALCRRLALAMFWLLWLVPCLRGAWQIGGGIVAGVCHLALIWFLFDSAAHDFDARAMHDLAAMARVRRLWYCLPPLLFMTAFYCFPQLQQARVLIACAVTFASVAVLAEVLLLSFFRRASRALLEI